jgi:hypothetical protein
MPVSTSSPDSACVARLVYRPEYHTYDFGPEHPLRPVRIVAALDLIGALGLLPAAIRTWNVRQLRLTTWR